MAVVRGLLPPPLPPLSMPTPAPLLLSLCVCRATSIGLGVVSTADASALVKIGSTTVLAGVKCEVMPAVADAPDEGRLTLQVGGPSQRLGTQRICPPLGCSMPLRLPW